MGQKITVTCYAGYKADERPTSFTLNENRSVVVEVLDRWYDQNSNYFKVLAADGTEHLLRHDLNEDVWELVQRGEEKL